MDLYAADTSSGVGHCRRIARAVAKVLQTRRVQGVRVQHTDQILWIVHVYIKIYIYMTVYNYYRKMKQGRLTKDCYMHVYSFS